MQAQTQTSNISKERRFYEYLLELTKLSGKVVRDYREYEKYWDPKKLREIEGCYVENECEDSDTFLKIHKPRIEEHEKVPPRPDDAIKEWLNFNTNNENSFPDFEKQKRYINEHGEENFISFEDDQERVNLYQDFMANWKEWAQNLKEKEKLSALYNEFFDLVSRFDREGESLELVIGRGILVWKHPDRKVGLIRSPLLTQKLELDLDAEKGVIIARRIESVNNVEREMLTGVNLPNKNRVDAILNSLKSLDITDDISDLLTQLINIIDADGEYKKPNGEYEIRKTPVIFDDTVFVFRVKSTRVLRDDLENIIEQIDSDELKINEAIRSILGEEVDICDATHNEMDEALPEALTKNGLFFPLEYNEQQKEIVERIEKNFGVTVQGPPGTGKTHTIANLVSHFLAKGKRVLITSQKESPLRVLKSKIPKDIQDLCVPVLGGGRDSLQEIERSINTISEKLGELDTDKLSKSVSINLKKLDESKRNEAKLVNQLREYMEKEGSAIKYKGEELFKYDVAKLLSKTNVNYNWIVDELKMDAVFPLSEVEFKELWQFRNLLNAEDLKLHSTDLPRIGVDIKNQKSFKDLVQNGMKLSQGKGEGAKHLEAYRLPKNVPVLDKIIIKLKSLLSRKHIINNEGYKWVLNDLKAGGVREERWTKLIDDLQGNVDQLFHYYNRLVTHTINLPDKRFNEIKEDIKIAKERIDSGKKPNLTFFLFKGKQTKYLFEEPILNGNPLSKAEDFEPINDYIQYQELKAETARNFNGNMQEINHPHIEEDESRFPHLLQERLQELREVIKTFDILTYIKGKLVTNNIDLYAVDDLSSLVVKVKESKNYLIYSQWLDSYQKELNSLKSYGKHDHNHPIVYEMIKAFENRDTNKWSSLLDQLLEIYKKKEDVNKFYELLSKLDNNLPLTKRSIESSISKEEILEFPHDYLEAFELRKLKTWLDQTKDISASKLRTLIEKEKNTQRQLIENIIRDASWKNQIERITEKEKRALSSWKTYIKRYGKGTGQNRRYLSSAREAMKDAQSAIPVWIMPTMQVLENFSITNDKFDIIIFDESSQCDIFSTNVLLRGKKMIVVGDDEQISPQAIGIKQESVDELVNRYLPDIPNSDLFDGNISLYEIAEQTFPKAGKLMLREHFRCVPEIIQFSNDLSYGGEMVPLRLPLEEEKIDPPVKAIMVEEGYNDEKDKDINRPEAEAIVHDIEKIVRNPKYSDQTIGVITLQGNKQHKLLENLIRDKIGDAEYVARKIICGNPYDLQGDERDIVFLSMVVAPNRRFRSLTKSSEKQRYNVAASRAKNQMRLYHSIETSDLNPNDLRYELLSYCKNPTRVNEELEDLEGLCDSPFEVDVLRMILAKGYKVTPQVKVGGYRIDLVIEGIRDRLAVECDGEKWHGPEKFEEDMQRQESLERSGWKFWRIRGREFYFDRKKAMESLWVRLSEMGIEPNLSQETKNNEEKDMDDGNLKNSLESQQRVKQDLKIREQQSLFKDGVDQQLGFFDENL